MKSMQKVNFDEVLFRCSSLGHLMTEPKLKADKEAGNLSDTAKTHLRDVYVSKVLGRNTDISNKYLLKGNMVEEDSITLYSNVKKQYFQKNEEHLKNDFIMGTPDIRMVDGKVYDIKSRWDALTFVRTINEPMDKMNYWQIMGYGWIESATTGVIVNTLVNTPFVQIQSLLKKESYQWPEMVPAWREIEIIKNAVFDFNTFEKYVDMVCHPITDEDKKMYDSFVEIPPKNRINEVEVEIKEEEIEALKVKIQKSREHLKTFDLIFRK